ncbi:T9SS type A sorting domain-containing protein [Pedobacter nanyangensis]|uniref:T9SS type A sorting domain-containing protein n=1 Tax=Pedobacter nanyangensis TaxID=1562389 RepID=UPI000DE3DCD0|nr:T9SS type A sorting domain-containing protein [Pedobacter nanyangensis]
MIVSFKKIGYLLPLLLLSQVSQGQIFSQSFSTSTVRTDYIGSSANKFDGISNFGNAPSTITGDALRFAKNGASSAFFVRTTSLGTATPNFIKFQFKLNVAIPTTLNNNQSYDASLYIGDGTDVGFSDPSQVTAPVNASTHTKLNIKLLVSASSAKFAINGKEYSGVQTITLFVNNTGDTIPKIYTTPNGKKAMVAHSKFDVWVGNEQVINEGAATTANVALQKFKFICPSGAPNAILDFDDISITDNAFETPSLWKSIVKYQAPSSGMYLGSPSLLKLANGNIIASNDYFGPNRPSDSQGRSNYTSIYKSTDNGLSWSLLTNISGMYWANLFEHKGNVYLLGVTAATASIAIRKSTDGGLTWTAPTSATTGLLFNEGTSGAAPRYHGAPTPVLKANGRLYRAFENIEDTSLSGYRGYRAFAISIDEDDDLMDASKWTKTNEIAFNSTWDPPGSAATTGWLEGNMVQGPDGKIWNMLRVNSTPFFDRSAKIEISSSGSTATFSPSNFFTFPGGSCKFVVRKDTVSGVYWAMLNDNTNGVEPNQRNVLALYASTDLTNWYLAKTLIADDQNYTAAESITYTGFQYPDWQFDGNNIIYLSRTAYGDDVPRAHDSNFITFGVVENYNNDIPSELLSTLSAPNISFTGSKEGNQVKLAWQTKDAKTTSFMIYRSTDHQDFELVGTTNAHSQTDYQYTDRTPFAGNNYYKLSLKDADGKLTALDKVVRVNTETKENSLSAYQKENNAEINFFWKENPSTAYLSIIDMGGKLIAKQKITVNSGYNKYSVSLPSKSGFYVVQVLVNKQAYSFKF